MNTKDFDPFNLDEVERLQRIEDGELDDDTRADDANGEGGDGEGDGNDDGNGAGDGDGNPQGNANDQAGEGGQAGQQQSANDADGTQGNGGDKHQKPTGVLSKDGTRVLPYSALTQARKQAQDATRQVQELRAQLEAEKEGKGKTQTQSETDIDLSDEELAEIESDYPQLAKVAKLARIAKQRLNDLDTQATARSEPIKGNDDGQPSGDPIQDAIDANPDLLTWQTENEHASKFQRAIEFDNLLKSSPKWQGKPLAERFAEATRRVREEFDIEEQPQQDASRAQGDNKPNKTQQSSRQQQAREVVNRTQRRGPTTLSDVKGGAAPARDNVASLSPTAMLSKFEGMSTDDILAQLDRGA